MKFKFKYLVLLSAVIINNNVFSQTKGDYIVQGKVPNAVLIDENNEDDVEIEIPQNPAESRLWLNFFQENGQLESFNTLVEWETVNETSIVSNLGIKSSTNNENEVAVPQGNLGIRSIYNLDFSNNELRNVDFLVSLEEIRGDIDFRNNNISNLNGMYFVQNINGNAYFDNNQINSINNLLNLTTIGGELTLHNNPNITNLYGLKSITSGTIRLDDPTQYTQKVDFYSDFCQQFDDGNIFVYLQDSSTQITKSEVCEADPWLTFFQENGQLGSFNQMIEWEDDNDFTTANLDNAGFNNFDLPAGNLGIDSLYRLDFSNNELTTLNFMENVTKLRDSLVVDGNFIRDITKLSGITVVEGDINLANNSLRRLDGLENITEIDRLFINNNPLTDLTPIENLFNVNEIYIDEASQYQKIDFSKPLCNSFINGVADFVVQSTGLSAEVNDICDNVPQFSAWLEYFQGKGQLTDFNDIFDWIIFDDIANLNNQNIEYTDFVNLPKTIGVYSIFALDMSQNKLRLVDFLGSVREVRTNLNLQSNDLRNVAGLQQLESANVLDISKNSFLADIRGLANLKTVNQLILDDEKQYNLKPDYSSDFCQNIEAGNINAVRIDGERLSVLELCSNVPDDIQWLSFFQKYNQLKDISILSNWQSIDEKAVINRGLNNNNLPQVSIPLESIYSLNLDNNNLIDISFMSQINEIRENFSIKNNKLIDLKGFDNVLKVKNLDLSGNLLESLNGLNLQEAAIIDLTLNSNLKDISNLETIEEAQKIIIDNPAQYIAKPDANSPFCQQALSGNIIISQNNFKDINAKNICEGSVSAQDAWLYFFNKKEQLLGLEKLEDWTDSEMSVDLQFETLNNSRVPNYNFGVNDIYSLNFNYNQFSNVDFLQGVKLVEKDLFLNNNLINKTKGFFDLEEVKGIFDISNNELGADGTQDLINLKKVKELKIYNNLFLEDLNGLQNIEGNTKENPVILRLDPTSMYASNHRFNRRYCCYVDTSLREIAKLDLYTPLCFGIATGRTIAYVRETENKADMNVICEGLTNDAAWLDFFKDNGQLLSFNLLNEWNINDEVSNVSSKDFNDSDLPSGTMGTKSIFSLDFSNNNLTNVQFMGLTEEVRGLLDLSNNNITSLSGLDLLNKVGELKIYNNNYDDLIHISNISIATAIRIDNPDELNKIPYTLPLCQGIENGTVNIYLEEETSPLALGRVCYTADTDPNTAWLTFFNNNNQLTNFVELTDWEKQQGLANISNLNILNSDIPSSLMQIDSLDSLDFSNNNLVNMFFLSNVERIRGYLDLSSNNLSNISGFTNLKFADVVRLHGNGDVSSLIPLSNLGNANQLIIDNPSQYTEKPSMNTNFCLGVKNLRVNVVNLDKELSLKDVCSDATDEEEWLNFFQASYNTLLPLSKLSDWLVFDEVAEISAPPVNNNEEEEEEDSNTTPITNITPIVISPIDNSDLPNSNLPINSIYELIIKDQLLTNTNFLSNVNEIRKNLNLSNNNISDLNGLSNLNVKVPSLNLSNNNISGLSSLSGIKFSNLNLSNNNISNTEGLDFEEIDNLYLNDNSIDNLNGLNNLLKVNGELSIINNNTLTDITGLSNLSFGKVNIDLVSQYTTKPDFDTPFCKAILANNVSVFDLNGNKVYVEEICMNVTDDALWLSFFHRNNQLLLLDEMNNWNTFNEEALLSGLTLNEDGDLVPSSKIYSNSDFPTGNIGVTSLYTLDFSHNNITSIDFLSGLENVRGDLLLSNNNLLSISSLSELTEVSGRIDLSNTNISDVSNLSKLKKVDILDLSGNPNITNLSGIERLANALTLYLDDPSQYELIDFTSDVCFAISRGEVLPKVKSTGSGIYIEELCDGVPNDAKWLSYLQSKGQLLGFTMLNDWERIDATAEVKSQNLTVVDIPSARMPTSQIYKLDLSDNLLTNISFMNLIETVRDEINFSNNKIDNISGLGRLKNANTINLSNNNIDSLDDMSSIESLINLDISNNTNLRDISQLRNIQNVVELKMNNTAVTTLTVLENYTSMTTLEFEGSPITDISALAELSPINMVFSDPALFENKPDFNSTICQNYYNDIKNNLISDRVYNYTYNNNRIYLTHLCSNIPSDIAWLDFFQAENQLTYLSNFSEWETKSYTATVQNRNLRNGLLPPDNFGLNSIYS